MNAKLTLTEHDMEFGAQVETIFTTSDLGMLVRELLQRMEPMTAYMLVSKLHKHYGNKTVR